jgi:hypothetical protein
LIVLKKTIVSNLPEALMAVAMGFYLWNAIEPLITFLGVLGVAIWSLRLLGNIIKSDYIILHGEQVAIQDNFRKWTFNQSDIECVSLNYSPFSQSYFKLNNGLKRHFKPWKLSKVDTEKFNLICNKIK